MKYDRLAPLYDRIMEHVNYDEWMSLIQRIIKKYCPVSRPSVLELGAGTGRLTRLLAPLTNTIWAFDISGHMLGVAAKTLQAKGARNWKMAIADHRNIPLADGIADVVISGWSVGCLAAWSGKEWTFTSVTGYAAAVLMSVFGQEPAGAPPG